MTLECNWHAKKPPEERAVWAVKGCKSYKGYNPCFKWQQISIIGLRRGRARSPPRVHGMAVLKVVPSASEFRAILWWTGCLWWSILPPALTPEYGHLYIHMYICMWRMLYAAYIIHHTLYVLYYVLYGFDYGIFRSLFKSARRDENLFTNQTFST